MLQANREDNTTPCHTPTRANLTTKAAGGGDRILRHLPVNRREFLRRWLPRTLGVATIAGLGAAITLGLGRVLRGWGLDPAPPWRLPLEPPILGAHRGGAALFPEHTMEAFRGSYQRFGFRFMELDVHASRDGVPVVIHDETVDRTTDGTGAVANLTLAELKQFDAGYRFRDLDGASWAGRGLRIPTLEEVLRELPESVFSIEIKQHTPPCEAAVVQAIYETDTVRRVLVGSGRQSTARRAQALAPDIPTFYSFRAGVVFIAVAMLGLTRWYRPPHNALLTPSRLWGLELITPRLLKAAHTLGVPVLVWTINDPAEMTRLLGLGVDGVITDRPDLLVGLVRSDAARAP